MILGKCSMIKNIFMRLINKCKDVGEKYIYLEWCFYCRK